MAQKATLFEKMKSGSNKVRIGPLLKIMDFYGFITHNSKEGYFFTHDQLRNITLPRVPKPHKKSGELYIKKPYVDKCIKAIELLIGPEKEEG